MIPERGESMSRCPQHDEGRPHDSTSVWAAPIIPASPWNAEVSRFLCGEEDALVDPSTGAIAGTLVPAADLRLDRPRGRANLLNNLWLAPASYIRDATLSSLRGCQSYLLDNLSF